MRINFYAMLRGVAGTKGLEIQRSEPAPAASILRELTGMRPALATEFWDGEGNWRNHIKVFLNGRDLTHLHGLETVVAPEDQLDIFPPVGGGQRVRRAWAR